ncbi:MAG: glutamine--fructose-6-phosphate transaminase (isomerizing) [Pseudomonadota bacterium]
MCGIVGVIARTEATPMLIEALRRLEYRGYDSAGVATVFGGDLDRRRAVGKLSALADVVSERPLRGMTGIGHTRWATHGAPTIENAHPHMTPHVAVVHNGIIENYRELRQELEDAGRRFESDTDTEIVAQLLSQSLEAGAAPKEAAARTLERLDGAFALCMLFRGHEDLLIAARQGSPLAIGYGDDEMFVGSDALALAPMTNRVCYLEEGDWAIVTRSGAEIYSADGMLANREVKSIALSSALVDKGEHRHFMAKEIHEQPSAMAYTLANYLAADRMHVVAPFEELRFEKTPRVTLIACGTAFYACAIAKYWLEGLAGLPADIDIASEFRYRDPILEPGGVAIFVSQSGETADTLAALRFCRAAGQTIISIVNVPTSTIARESDIVLPTLAGPEIGVASTKAFTCQLIALASMAILAARQRQRLARPEERELVRGLTELPTLMSRALSREKRISRIAAGLARARDVLFLGRGPMYPLAMEGALKLKEISYIHAEGYASGELKHGPIALVDDNVPVVVLAPSEALFEKTVSNMQEVMARGGKVILISDREGVEAAGEGVWHAIQMPPIDPRLAPLLYAAPVQLLAYHTAVHKGTDVDQPRNLAKSVTVE